ncbi:MAG: sodium/solute symporter [Pirellulales bacterium]|nr:sodium/solute symporter [Planctomycetales bacterium]
MEHAVSELASIDYVILGAYMVGMLAIGTFYAKYVHTAGDLFLAGRALPFWAIGLSIVVSDIGAIDLVSGSGAAYEYGIAQANFDWLGSVPAVLIAAFIFVPYYWRAGVYTIPEFLGRRYNVAVQMIEALIWFAFLSVNVSVMLYLSAVFLGEVLDWNVEFSIWLTAVFVGIYTVSGGLSAVVMTDVLQMVVMFVGAGSLLVLGLWEAGGWEDVVEAVKAQPNAPADYFQLLAPHAADTPYPWTGIVFGLGIVMSTAYFVGNQAVLQRALGARSEWDAKAGLITAGFFKLFIPLLMFVPGLTGRALWPDLAKADTAVPRMVAELLPPGLMGLMFAAFLAALMSSVDSYLNSCSTMFMTDVYGRGYHLATGRNLGDRQGMVLGRIVTVVVLLIAAFAAPQFSRFATIYTAIQGFLALFQGPTLAILLLGIMWPRATRWGGLSGLVLGVCMTSFLTFEGDRLFPSQDPFLFVSFWSFLFSLAVTAVVSLLTPREPPEKLRGLVMSSVMQDAEAESLLAERVAGHE